MFIEKYADDSHSYLMDMNIQVILEKYSLTRSKNNFPDIIK